MNKQERARLAADRLLEMASRVLGQDAGRADRYAYINLLLSQLGNEVEMALRTELRVHCYERLFGLKSEEHPRS